MLSVLREKLKKENMSSNDEIGRAEENESDLNGTSDAEDDLDYANSSKSLTTTNFSDVSGEAKMLETSKQKRKSFRSNERSWLWAERRSFCISECYQRNRKTISGSNGKTEEDDRNDNQRLSSLESDSSLAKEDVSSERDKLDSNLKLLAPK